LMGLLDTSAPGRLRRNLLGGFSAG